MKGHTSEEIKYRLSGLGVQIGNIAIEYITELEKGCEETQELLDKQIEATYKLDKENAGLKQKLEVLEGQTPWKDIKDKSEIIGKLTKAKEIIKTLADDLSMYSGSYQKELLEAKQFLEKVK